MTASESESRGYPAVVVAANHQNFAVNTFQLNGIGFICDSTLTF